MAPNITGVALIVVNKSGEVLMLQECETNPKHGKIAEQWSVPMETSREGESDAATLRRLLVEEIPGVAVAIEPLSFRSYEVVSDALVKLYIGSTDSFFLPSPDDFTDGVSGHCWLMPEQATMLWLRRGAWEMLLDFKHGRRGSVRKTCRAVAPLADQFLFKA